MMAMKATLPESRAAATRAVKALPEPAKDGKAAMKACLA